MRQQLGNPRATLPVLFEVSPGAEQLRFLFRESVHEGEALARHERVGNRLIIKFLQRRLIVVEFELTRRPGHEKVDDALGRRGKIQLSGGKNLFVIEQGEKRKLTKSQTAAFEEMAARFEMQQV